MTEKTENEIKTRNARIWLDDNGIIRIVSSPGIMETLLEDAESNVAAIRRIYGGKKRPCFINAGPRKSATREARLYYVKKFPELVTAVAIMQYSPVVKVFVNFMMGLNQKINKGNLPARLFTSEQEALEWLKGYET